jgi:hypothetical protein
VRSLIEHVDAFVDIKKTVLHQFASKIRRKLFLLVMP